MRSKFTREGIDGGGGGGALPLPMASPPATSPLVEALLAPLAPLLEVLPSTNSGRSSRLTKFLMMKPTAGIQGGSEVSSAMAASKERPAIPTFRGVEKKGGPRGINRVGMGIEKNRVNKERYREVARAGDGKNTRIRACTQKRKYEASYRMLHGFPVFGNERLGRVPGLPQAVDARVAEHPHQQHCAVEVVALEASFGGADKKGHRRGARFEFGAAHNLTCKRG